MVDTLTTHFSWVMPQDQDSNNTWGAKLNSDLQAIDAQVWMGTQAFVTVANYNPQFTPSNFNLDSSASANATISFLNSVAPSGKQLRWQLVDDNSAETGGNAGSDFSLRSYDDTGALIGSPITVNRQSGAVGLGLPGSAVTFNGTATFTQNLSSTSSFSCGSPLTIGSAPYGGADTAPLSMVDFPTALTIIQEGTGQVEFNLHWGNIVSDGANLTIYGPWHAGSPGQTDPLPAIGGDTSIIQMTIDPSNPASPVGYTTISGEVNFTGGGSGSYFPTMTYAAGTLYWMNGPGPLNNSPPIAHIQVDASGNFIYQGNGNALKPGGGSWGALSDERIKEVDGEYELGLDAVTQLRPVRYRYKAEPDKERVGLVAQEVEEIMPGMVTQGEGVIDGQSVSDMRTLDTTELLFALVNCVRELKAEIEALRAQLT